MSIPMKEKKVVTEVCVNVIPEIYFTFGSIDWIKIKAIDGTIMIEDSSTSRTKALLEQKSIIDSTKKVQSTLDSSQNSKNEFKKEGLKKHSHVRKFDPRNTQMRKKEEASIYDECSQVKKVVIMKASKCEKDVVDNKVKDKEEASTCKESSQDNKQEGIHKASIYSEVFSSINSRREFGLRPSTAFFKGMDIDKWKQEQKQELDNGEDSFVDNGKTAHNLQKFNRAIANSNLMHHKSKHKSLFTPSKNV